MHYLSSISLIAACAFAVSGEAVPTSDYPEVIPGPGLPSLESIGLTSKMLYEMTSSKTSISKRIEKRYTCQNWGLVPVANAQACKNYLANIGGQECGISGDNAVFCTSGSAQIGGSNVGGGSSDQQICGDVAITVGDLIQECVQGSNVQGYDYCYGDGNMIVSIEIVGE